MVDKDIQADIQLCLLQFRDICDLRTLFDNQEQDIQLLKKKISFRLKQLLRYGKNIPKEIIRPIVILAVDMIVIRSFAHKYKTIKSRCKDLLELVAEDDEAASLCRGL